jgi:NAD(P)H dehydrogenase (quinone)
MDTIQGGSAYGAGTFAGGDGSRMPSENELTRAKLQGEGFAKVAKKLAS